MESASNMVVAGGPQSRRKDTRRGGLEKGDRGEANGGR